MADGRGEKFRSWDGSLKQTLLLDLPGLETNYTIKDVNITSKK